MKKFIGWLAIILAILSLAPSIVPGAMSLIGLLVSLFSLILSIFSVEINNRKFFIITLSIVVFGVFLLNGVLRVWEPLPMPGDTRLMVYGVLALIIAGSGIAASQLSMPSEK